MPAQRSPGRGSDLAPPLKPGPDVYVGLLGMSLIALVFAALFLWMDYSQYGDKPARVPPPQAIGQGSPGAAPAPAAQPPAAPAAQPPAAPAPAAPGTPAPAAQPPAGGAQPAPGANPAAPAPAGGPPATAPAAPPKKG